MQPDYVKRRVEREIVDTMKKYPGGRDTRQVSCCRYVGLDSPKV